LKGIWAKLNIVAKSLLTLTPIVAAAAMMSDPDNFEEIFFHNSEVPMWLLLFGSAGQIIFTLRFVYQWAYSRRHKESLLPAGFWIISLIGSSIIISYGIFRLDPVLILGQSFGFVAYIRNLIIGHRNNKETHA
jgi:lipid-A-disaccharide synthase-like uncharacterized protein